VDSPPITTHRPHVLIVSDDEGLATFLGEGLVYGGFWTSTVASGILTLEVFRLRSFDLVLVDAALGDLSALEVVRRLRGRSNRVANGPRTSVPILFVTDAANEFDRTSLDESGADGLLTAPLDLETLVPQLHGVVADWRARHPDYPWADEAAQRPAGED
jgi:DNA-binding response OmpR family regulator